MMTKDEPRRALGSGASVTQAREVNVFCGEMYIKSHTERLPEAYFAETSTAAREGHPVTEWLAVPSSTADLNPIDLATLSHRPQPFRVIQPGQLRRLWNA
jgi:hypothetical protein